MAKFKGRGKARSSRKRKVSEQSKCRFCREKVDQIDYKDIATLQKLTTDQGKLFSRKRSGNCARHQRSACKAVKLARFMGLMPYVG